jgi:hypothetical protein
MMSRESTPPHYYCHVTPGDGALTVCRADGSALVAPQSAADFNRDRFPYDKPYVLAVSGEAPLKGSKIDSELSELLRVAGWFVETAIVVTRDEGHMPLTVEEKIALQKILARQLKRKAGVVFIRSGEKGTATAKRWLDFLVRNSDRPRFLGSSEGFHAAVAYPSILAGAYVAALARGLDAAEREKNAGAVASRAG